MTTTIADTLRERLYMRALIEAVCVEYHCIPQAMYERTRSDRMVVEARMLVALRARECHLTLDVIGDALRRDHSSVAFVLDRHAENFLRQRYYRDLLAELPAFDPMVAIRVCGGCNGSGVYPLDRDVPRKHARGCGACHGIGGWEY